MALHPPPLSRQASYTYSLSGGSPFKGTHRREASSSAYTAVPDEDDDVGDVTFEQRLGIEEQLEGVEQERGLEETLEKLGFGAYQWRLLTLCGLGWMSDNSALQCIAVILPRVQVHFNLESETVGLLSACIMAGMMVGAVGWGTISDLVGRALPFHTTLFLTAVFGIGASFAPTFPILCIWMFFLGSAVGGSMPTDGTLFLENLPHSKQYLLTLLSVFFSLGAVLSSVVSMFLLPGSSCRRYEGCDIANKENDGWRRVLFALGIFNLVCSLARWGLIRLHESPRYLVSNGRQQEAVIALRAIANYNSHEMEINHEDVAMAESHTHHDEVDGNGAIYPPRDKKDSSVPTPELDGEHSSIPLHQTRHLEPSSSLTDYNAVGEVDSPRRHHAIRTGSAFFNDTPFDELREVDAFERSFTSGRASEDEVDLPRESKLPVDSQGRRTAGTQSWAKKWGTQLGKLFSPHWRRTVILMWLIWGCISFAYTMFNVWLPAVLESRAGEGDGAIRAALKEYVLYSIAGCPGSIVGAWMIQTRLGRRKSLAICTAATSISTFAFIAVSADWAVVVSSMIISAAATAMYAVLYGMTPETFGTEIRGTACGTSAAISRLTGVMAPISAGFFLHISSSLPLFVSAAVFIFTAGCSLALPFERVAEVKRKGSASFAH